MNLEKKSKNKKQVRQRQMRKPKITRGSKGTYPPPAEISFVPDNSGSKGTRNSATSKWLQTNTLSVLYLIDPRIKVSAKFNTQKENSNHKKNG